MSDGARFLLVCHDAGGTVPPMLAVGEALVDRGHDVTVLSQPSVASRAEAIDATFVEFSDLPDYPVGVALEEDVALPLRAMVGHAVGDDVLAVVDRCGIDAVLVDANLTGAAAAAEAARPSSAILLHSLYRTYVDVWFGEVWPFLVGDVNETRARFGVEPCDSWAALFARHDRVYSAAPAVLEEPPTGVRSFGFLVPRARAAASVDLPAGDDPLVLVSLSTTYQRQEELLQTILDGLRRLPVRGLVTTAGQVDGAALRLPLRVEVREHVPHADVLGAVDAVVTHAGLGTIAATISHGVPLVCTPIARDQPLNAGRVAALGAGITVEPESATAEAVADAVRRVLADPAYRRSAVAVADASRAAGGAPVAAADLESLAT